MSSTLLPALRNLRAALLTGGLILAILYIFLGSSISKDVELRESAVTILNLVPFMDLMLITFFSSLVGSLYMTSLEGFVDWVHRRYIFTSPVKENSLIKRKILQSFVPFSNSAWQRITFEAGRFYDEKIPYIEEYSQNIPPSRDEFVRNVAREILWLEGKLVGTSLEAPYDRYRTEGELRLGTALLIPFCTLAITYATQMGAWTMVFFTIGSLCITVKLADYGFYYFRRSHSFMAHHVADGTLFTPSMETFNRTIQRQENTRVCGQLLHGQVGDGEMQHG